MFTAEAASNSRSENTKGNVPTFMANIVFILYEVSDVQCFTLGGVFWYGVVGEGAKPVFINFGKQPFESLSST